MIRICVVCEGQTEVEFVKKCLAPYFFDHHIHIYPSLLQAPSGRHRGGRVTIERLVKFISHQCRETDRITTLIDFYGFKDRGNRNCEQLEQAIRVGVEQKTTDYDPRFVLPYVQMHEFESLLFSDIDQFKLVLDGWNNTTQVALKKVRCVFKTPEDINDSIETAPSKRIWRIFEGAYSKVQHGSLIAEAIGIKQIREQCPRFNNWVQQLLACGSAV
jgi:hypothetical protein